MLLRHAAVRAIESVPVLAGCSADSAAQLSNCVRPSQRC